MSKSDVTARRIGHIICGLDAWVLHEVLVGRNSIEQPQENSLIDHLRVLARGVLLPVLPVQDRSAVLVELQGGNNYVAGVDADGCGRAAGLVSMHTVDVDDPFFAVDLGDLALPTLELASYDQYLVVFAHR